MLGPWTETLACSANLYVPTGTTFETGGSILSRFLSLLAWSMERPLVARAVFGSNHPAVPTRAAHGGRYKSVWMPADPWWTIYLPTVTDPKARLALALFREGMGVASAPLAFLSFFKVFNIVHAGGAAQRAWIDGNIGQVRYGPEKDRLAELRQLHPSVGEYMWEQGRCAVAHANDVTVNPDEYADKRRLAEDLPLIQELAALFIESQFGVQRQGTFNQRLRENGCADPQLFVQIGDRDSRLVYGPGVDVRAGPTH